MVNYTGYFFHFNQLFIHGINPWFWCSLIFCLWCILIFVYDRIWFVNILLRSFGSMFIADIVCNFLAVFLSGLVSGQCCPHEMNWEVLPPLVFSWRVSVELLFCISYMFGRIPQWGHRTSLWGLYCQIYRHKVVYFLIIL